MRKTSVCILTLALMLGTAALSLAADTKAPAKDQGTTAAPAGSTSTAPAAPASDAAAKPAKAPKTPKKPACKPAHGAVASKDDAAKSFVVHPAKGADVTFMTNDKTTYWKGKAKSSWADLAVGDTVHVTCTMDGTNMVAKTVKISAPKTTGKKPAADAAPKQ